MRTFKVNYKIKNSSAVGYFFFGKLPKRYSYMKKGKAILVQGTDCKRQGRITGVYPLLRIKLEKEIKNA